jgi:hypothetical protein
LIVSNDQGFPSLRSSRKSAGSMVFYHTPVNKSSVSLMRQFDVNFDLFGHWRLSTD